MELMSLVVIVATLSVPWPAALLGAYSFIDVFVFRLWPGCYKKIMLVLHGCRTAGTLWIHGRN